MISMCELFKDLIQELVSPSLLILQVHPLTHILPPCFYCCKSADKTQLWLLGPRHVTPPVADQLYNMQSSTTECWQGRRSCSVNSTMIWQLWQSCSRDVSRPAADCRQVFRATTNIQHWLTCCCFKCSTPLLDKWLKHLLDYQVNWQFIFFWMMIWVIAAALQHFILYRLAQMLTSHVLQQS